MPLPYPAANRRQQSRSQRLRPPGFGWQAAGPWARASLPGAVLVCTFAGARGFSTTWARQLKAAGTGTAVQLPQLSPVAQLTLPALPQLRASPPPQLFTPSQPKPKQSPPPAPAPPKLKQCNNNRGCDVHAACTHTAGDKVCVCQPG